MRAARSPSSPPTSPEGDFDSGVYTPMGIKLPRGYCTGTRRSLEVHEIVILGGGTGGTLTANRLRRAYGRGEARITVVDQDDGHVYQPGLLFVPFGLTHAEDIVRPRARQLHAGHRVPPPPSTVWTSTPTPSIWRTGRQARLRRAGRRHRVPTGARGDRRTDRCRDGWRRSSPSTRLKVPPRCAGALAEFDGGRLVVNVVDMPIKCPVAPLEFCFLADWYFRERGIRDARRAHLRDPARRRLHQAGGARAARQAARRARASNWSPSSTPGRSTAPAGGWSPTTAARSPSTSPSSSRSTAVRRTWPGRPGLGDELGFVADRRAHAAVTGPPERVRHRRRRRPARSPRRGRSPTSRARSWSRTSAASWPASRSTPVSTGTPTVSSRPGFHKALLIDFNYDIEPLPGHFPGDGRTAAAEGVAPQPSRQADVPVALLAQPPARTRHPRHRHRHADRAGKASRARARTAPREGGARPCPPTPSPDVDVDVNDEGFFEDPRQWTEDDGRRDRPSARASTSSPTGTGRSSSSCGPSTTRRAPGRPSGSSGKTSGVPVKELYQLFPKGPAKLAAKIAGIPKPRGCI